MTNERRDDLLNQIAAVARPGGRQLIMDIGSGVKLTKEEGVQRLANILLPEMLKINSGELAELFALFLAEYNLAALANVIQSVESLLNMAREAEEADDNDPSQN